MKKITTLITLILTMMMIAGCGSSKNSATNPSVEENGTTAESTTSTQHTTIADTSNTQHTTTADTAQPTQNAANGDHIGEARAKELALVHAGVAADHATFVKSGLDRENGREVYDVEFYSKDHTEYDYDIDAYTGEVLSYDRDAEYYPDPATDTTIPADAITEAKAKELALAKVPGSAETDIRKFKMDYEDGRLVYEGKIYYDHKEYEFEIDGYTGEFKEWDEEIIYQ